MAAASTAGRFGDQVVETGRVFGQGGTDGLILYALILANFLMFAALIIHLIVTSRTMHNMSKNCHDEGVQFAEASKEAASALRELAQSIASKAAGDQAHQQAVSALMGQILSARGRIDRDQNI